MKAKIYTKTGDQGQTSLIGGTRVAKTNLRIAAYGSLDELNSVIGLVRGQLDTLDHAELKSQLKTRIQSVQNNLFNVGSHLACENSESRQKLPRLNAELLSALEKDMDQWEAALPPLKQFILPGGSTIAGFAHLARTICRRSEREILKLKESELHASHDVVELDVIQFVNRLSDWLFVLARITNHALKIADITWDQN